MHDISQGSSRLATLGFVAESLWDSCSLAGFKTRESCSPSCPRHRVRVHVDAFPRKRALNQDPGIATSLSSARSRRAQHPGHAINFRSSAEDVDTNKIDLSQEHRISGRVLRPGNVVTCAPARSVVK